MKALAANLLNGRLKTLSPPTVFACGLCYCLVVAIIDHYTPPPLSMILFHLLGVLFVAWAAGATNALILAVLCVSGLTFEEWRNYGATRPAWILVWNAGSRFLVFAGAGWMAAEVSRLTHRLENLVAERTNKWKLEAEGHKATSARLQATVTDLLRLEGEILEISDREQARIGQDIHDGLCQQLVTLGFDANSLISQLTQERRPEAIKAKQIAELLDGAISEARQVSRGLFPVRLEVDGLASALDDLAQGVQERFRIACRFEGDDGITIPGTGSAAHLYRIAQEAVNNAVKHSQAKAISIRLSRLQNTVELRVEDDGNGLSQGNNGASSGMGLHIMDYRARSIGASLRISGRPEGGTIVSCRLEP